MNCYKKIVLTACATLLSTFFAVAQTIAISPTPQVVTWGKDVAFNSGVAFTLIGESDADQDAVNLFKKHFDTANGTVQVIIGERGDAAIESAGIPEADFTTNAEGYYLSIEAGKVIIAGNDNRGTYYGVQTFLQIASQPQVMEVSITDYPSISERGLVEGYYGNPYSESDRMNLFEFFGRQKMNTYIYGPKDDVYHKGEWRTPYPAELGNKIAEYAAAAKANKVDFVWAIHPGVDIKWNKADSLNIVNKLKKMYDLGIRTFAVFFDDIWGEGTDATKQAGIMNYIVEELNKAYDDVNPLILCPTQYNKGWTSGDYLNILGTKMDKSVRIMWTGNSVVDMIEMNDMQWINNQISRKAYIWLNYPVTDYCINRLLMGPTWGNGLDIANELGGFTSNPMEYAMASKLSLYSIGDYCWNMPAYNADASWESAMSYLMPRNKEAFRFFCQNNVDLGSTVHGLRRTNESPLFVDDKALFDSNMAAKDTTAAIAVMRKHFDKFINTATTLLTTDEAPELISEITPWLQCMQYMGQRGECIMDMYAALVQRSPEKFIDSYTKHQELYNAQEALRSRDFEGTLKWAKPEVATVHVAPFLKKSLAQLVTTYKSRYDYRTDIFPAQELENGTYFIKYNGSYLTNQTPNVASGIPRFVSERDDVRPQRQEWHISLDPETNRYKIVNAEDNRYLNENGIFSANNSTNPYDPSWHTYNITRMANGKYGIQNGGSAGKNYWTVSDTRVQQNKGTENKPDTCFIFDIEPITGPDNTETIESGKTYYIVVDGMYLTNDNPKGTGGAPTFKETAKPGKAQEWVIAQDPDGLNYYKITSKADGRYLNEYGTFGTNVYHADWNTYMISIMDNKYSISTTQSAAPNGARYWNKRDNRIDQDANLTKSSSHIFEIIKKGRPLPGDVGGKKKSSKK
ncbi:MAG: beta-N-acetylglucosaminidase domain-containing protein [Bacteroidaceae bacterium]|nr:beta-N-acetylglucosaminidase domain-containing protein [Bacteroidaceae bacterium]